MYHYHKDQDGFQLIDDQNGTVIYAGPEVAICFDKRDGTIQRHGDPVVVMAYFQKTTSTWMTADLEDMARDLVVVRSGAWDVEALNKCLHITGYAVRMMRDYGLRTSGRLGDLTDQLAAPFRPRPAFSATIIEYGGQSGK